MFAPAYVGRIRWGEAPTTALYPRLKAIEKSRLQPTYAGANMGHPDSVIDSGLLDLSMRKLGRHNRRLGRMLASVNPRAASLTVL
jgi:hypothetical protein